MTIFTGSGFADSSGFTVDNGGVDIAFDGSATFTTVSTSSSVYSEIITNDHAASSEIYARFKVEFGGLPASSNTDLFSLFDSTGTKVASISVSNAVNRFKVSNGSFFNGPADLVAGEAYDVWVYYSIATAAGSDGVLNVYYSLDGVKPDTPNLATSTGTNTNQIVSERITIINRGYLPVVFDYFCVADEEITDAQIAVFNIPPDGPKVDSVPSVDNGQSFDITLEEAASGSVSVSIDGVLASSTYDGGLIISVLSGWSSENTGNVELIVTDDTGSAPAFDLFINIPTVVLYEQNFNNNVQVFGHEVDDFAGYVSFSDNKLSMESSSGGNVVFVRTTEIDIPNDFWVQVHFKSESYSVTSDVNILQILDEFGSSQIRVAIRPTIPRFYLGHGASGLGPTDFELPNNGESYYLWLHVNVDGGTAELYFNAVNDFDSATEIPVLGGTGSGNLRKIQMQHNSRGPQGAHEFDDLMVYTGHPSDFVDYVIADDPPPPPTLLSMTDAHAGELITFTVDRNENPSLITASNDDYSLVLTDIVSVSDTQITAVMPLGGAPRGVLLSFQITDDNGESTTLDSLYLARAGYSTSLIAADPADLPDNSLYKLPLFSGVGAGDMLDYPSLIDNEYSLYINEFGIIQFDSSHGGGEVEVNFDHLDSSEGYESGSGIIRFSIPDVRPAVFSLGGDVIDAEPNTETIRSIVVSGLDSGVSVVATGLDRALVSLDGISWLASVSVANGDTVYVSVFSSSVRSETVIAGLDVSGVSDYFNVTTFAGLAPVIASSPAVCFAGTEFTITLNNPVEGSAELSIDGETFPILDADSLDISVTIDSNRLLNRLIDVTVSDDIGISEVANVFLLPPAGYQSVSSSKSYSDLSGVEAIYGYSEFFLLDVGDQVLIKTAIDGDNGEVVLNPDLSITMPSTLATGTYTVYMYFQHARDGYADAQQIAVAVSVNHTAQTGELPSGDLKQVSTYAYQNEGKTIPYIEPNINYWVINSENVIEASGITSPSISGKIVISSTYITAGAKRVAFLSSDGSRSYVESLEVL